MAKNILLIDNYDSFTYNLVHYLSALGAQVEVVRNDALSVTDIMGKKPHGIVISPGPASPNEAGICLDLITANQGAIPLLGVCLGHQSIGQAYGGNVVRAPSATTIHCVCVGWKGLGTGHHRIHGPGELLRMDTGDIKAGQVIMCGVAAKLAIKQLANALRHI